MCVYACINVLMKLMYFQQILYLLGVNKYYGYGGRGGELDRDREERGGREECERRENLRE